MLLFRVRKKKNGFIEEFALIFFFIVYTTATGCNFRCYYLVVMIDFRWVW